MYAIANYFHLSKKESEITNKKKQKQNKAKKKHMHRLIHASYPSSSLASFLYYLHVKVSVQAYFISTCIIASGAGFICPCGKCDLLKFLDDKCPNQKSNIFPYLDKRGLNDDERNTLELKLERDSKDIKLEFDVLVKETQRWASTKKENLHFTPKELKNTHLLMDLHIDKLNNAQTFDDIFDALNHSYSWSWLHFDILESIISLLSHKKMTPEFEEYKKCLNDYCKRRIYECPSYISRTHHKLRVPLLMKLPEDFVEKSLSELEKFEKEVFLITGVKHFVLLNYTKGCACLIYSLPKAVAEKTFPLSVEQTTMLEKLGVIECYLYQVEVNSLTTVF